jgi:hypothetical protein
MALSLVLALAPELALVLTLHGVCIPCAAVDSDCKAGSSFASGARLAVHLILGMADAQDKLQELEEKVSLT